MYSPKQVLKVCLELAKSEKRKKGKGRPPFYPDSLYIALLLFHSYFNLTYRATEAFYHDLFPGEPCPSFQSLHWFMKKKLSEEKLVRLFEELKERMGPFLHKKASLSVLDTTDVAHRRKTQKLSWMRDKFLREVRGHSRVCGLVQYFSERRLLVLEAVRVGGGYASDAVLGAEALRAASPGGILLADAGFNSSEVFAAAKGKFIPMIKLKGGGEVRDQMKKEAKRALDLGLYRLRGVAEGLFGGMKTKLNGALRSLRPKIPTGGVS